MVLKNGEQYVEGIRKMRPNIYKWGELIKDVTTDPATRLHIQSVKRSYDLSHDPEKASIYTAKSHLTGETVHRWNTLMQSAEDVMGNSNMKREQYHQSGTCQGATCAGWTAMNVLWDYHLADGQRPRHPLSRTGEEILAIHGRQCDYHGRSHY